MENNFIPCGANECTPHLSDGVLCADCFIAEEYWEKQKQSQEIPAPPAVTKKENNEELTEEKIRDCVSTNQRWCERAILAIYRKQTRSEQIAQETKEHNGVGFNGPDGHIMSYYAQWLLSGKHLNGRFREDAFKRISKYSKQLLAIANEIKGAKK